MVKMMRRTGRSITWALALALAVVSSATCVLGADMTQAQKACCAAMDRDCGAMAVKQDCCAYDAQTGNGLTALPPPISLLAPPALVAMDVPPTAPEHEIDLRTPAAFDAGAPNPSTRPTYLFVSVFRL